MARSGAAHTVAPLSEPVLFPAWFAAAHAAYALSGTPKPLTKAAREKLRLPRFRSGEGSAKLPKSLHAVFAAHRGYECWDAPLVPKLPTARQRHHLAGATLRAGLAELGVPEPEADVDGAPELDAADLPALVELPTGGLGKVYLYVAGERDGDGEYPVVALDDAPSLALRYASLAHYLTREFAPRLTKAAVCEAFDVDAVFAKALTRARKRCGKLLEREGVPLRAGT